jgi:outer membrane protein TolC
MVRVSFVFVLGASLIFAGVAHAQPTPVTPAQSALASLVAELEQKNPELGASRRDIDARAARVAPAGAPPDPTLTVGFRRFEIAQGLPYPGKLALKTQIAESDVEAARWAHEELRLRLISELKTSYIRLLFAARTLEILHHHKATLEHVREVAEARYAVGKTSQQDVLRAQLEISIVLHDIASVELDATMRRTEINRLVVRPADTPVTVADLLESAAPLTLDRLRADAEARFPGLKRDSQLIARGEIALALAQRERRPDFGVRFMTQRLTGEMPWMYSVDFTLTLPVFRGRKQQPMVAEAVATLDAARHLRESTRSDIDMRVAQETAAIGTSRRLMDLYADSVLPQAKLVLESATASYEVGSVDFLTLLNNVLTVRHYEIDFEEQRARYGLALARLEPLIGTELIR